MSTFLESAVKENFSTYLKFYLYLDAPSNHLDKWNSIRYRLLPFCKDTNKSLSITPNDIFNKWKSYCLLESNRKLPLQDRYYEGDPVGDNNQINKQIRPVEPYKLIGCWIETGEYYMGLKGEIRMKVIDGDDEKWTLEEIRDLLNAFVKTCDYYLSSHNVCGADIVLEG